MAKGFCSDVGGLGGGGHGKDNIATRKLADSCSPWVPEIYISDPSELRFPPPQVLQRIRPNLGHVLVTCCPKLTKIDQPPAMLSKLRQHVAQNGQFRPILAEIGPTLANADQPMSFELRQRFAKRCQTWPTMIQIGQQFRIWADSPLQEQLVGNCWSSFGQL